MVVIFPNVAAISAAPGPTCVGGVEQLAKDTMRPMRSLNVRTAHGLGERLAALSAVGERREFAGIGLVHRVGSALRRL